MGQKVHPKSFRLGYLETWNSKWITRKNYAKYLKEDILIRKYLKERLKGAGIAKIEIERSPTSVVITLHTSKPGLVIGRGGAGAEELKKELLKKYLEKKTSLNLNIQEVSQAGLKAELIVQNVIEQLEKRMPFRRVMKQTIDQVMRAGAQGVKITLAGRLDGAEIARSESLASGKIPLHTLRADIDYSRGAAQTTYGTVGAKVWIYRGEIFKKGLESNQKNVSTEKS